MSRWIALVVLVAVGCGPSAPPAPAKPAAVAFDHDRTGWPLTAQHAAIACTDCHIRTSGGEGAEYLPVEGRCARCHPAQPHGFARAELLACERCHDGAAWAPPRRALLFDHDDRADAAMPLVGAHRKVACAACHPASRFKSPLERPAACASCHATPHAGKIYATQACDVCHGMTTFTTVTSFDHSERTRYDLATSHRHIACASCHTAVLGMKAPSTACESCHAARAPHADRFKALGAPAPCGLCHAPTMPFDPALATRPAWKPNVFQHAKVSRWPLTHAHAEVSCRACHRGKGPTDFERLRSGTDCMGCHAHATAHVDDAHPKGRYTNAQCFNCHAPAGTFHTAPSP